MLCGSQVGTLRTIVGCSDKIAIECLNAGGWSVEGAVEVQPLAGASYPGLLPPTRAMNDFRCMIQLGVNSQACRFGSLAQSPEHPCAGGEARSQQRVCMAQVHAQQNCGSVVQVFYASGMSASAPAASRVNTNSIQQLFNRYADPTDGIILADGVGRFCDDLGVRARQPPVDCLRCVDVLEQHMVGPHKQQESCPFHPFLG